MKVTMKSAIISGKIVRNKIPLIIPIIFLLAFIYAYPFARTFVLGFFDISFGEVKSNYIGFDNYTNLFKEKIFWEALLNSFYWTLGNLVIQLILPIGLALLLNNRIKG
ncbi:MAG: hypothetical protein AB1798_21015, partial [Spirochaetota bacterium]